MERKSIVIDIPDGMCIDESNSTFEKIVFKKKDNKPRSWEEYCKNHYGDYYYISSDSNIIGFGYNPGHCELSPIYAKNIMPTKELAEAFLAMMQLMSLRQAWIGNWEPDWKDTTIKWIIVYEECKLGVCYLCSISHPLTFPTREMAEDFMNCFRDLLNAARPLI